MYEGRRNGEVRLRPTSNLDPCHDYLVRGCEQNGRNLDMETL